MKRHSVTRRGCPGVPLVAFEMEPHEAGCISIASEDVTPLAAGSWVVWEIDRPRLFDDFTALRREFDYHGPLDRDGSDDTPDLGRHPA